MEATPNPNVVLSIDSVVIGTGTNWGISVCVFSLVA